MLEDLLLNTVYATKEVGVELGTKWDIVEEAGALARPASLLVQNNATTNV